MARWLVRLGAVATVLMFSTPTYAQTTETEARRAAAFADYHRSCGSLVEPYIVWAMPDHRYTRSEAIDAVDLIFVERRTVESTRNYRRVSPLMSVAQLSAELTQTQSFHNRRQDGGSRLALCGAEVALRHAINGVPGYDRGAGTSLPSAPASRPNIAARPAPPRSSAAAKLPPARSVKMAAWSSKAEDGGFNLSPSNAPLRVDALNSCSAAIRNHASIIHKDVNEMSLWYERMLLSDSHLKFSNTVEMLNWSLGITQKRLESANLTPDQKATLEVDRCVDQRRIAQLEGAPLLPGARSGSLTPLSVGGFQPSTAPGGKGRTIASNGKSAKDCVELVELTKTDSRMGGGGRVLANHCSDEVEIGWCYSPGDCDNETGSGWTVQRGKSWPVKAEGEIRWAACHGANTMSFVEGTHGLRYYCKAPAKK